MLRHETHRENPEAVREGSYGRFLYNFYRTYDPNTGRYLEADPVGQLSGLNLFSYAGGNPVARTDPRGLLYGIPGFGESFSAGPGAAAPILGLLGIGGGSGLTARLCCEDGKLYWEVVGTASGGLSLGTSRKATAGASGNANLLTLAPGQNSPPPCLNEASAYFGWGNSMTANSGVWNYTAEIGSTGQPRLQFGIGASQGASIVLNNANVEVPLWRSEPVSQTAGTLCGCDPSDQ